MGRWRRHSLEKKREAVERMKTCANITALAREYKIQRKLLYLWKYQLEGRPEAMADKYGSESAEAKLRAENERLKQALAERTLEVDFFKGALRRIEARQQQSGSCGETASTKRSKR